MLFADGRIVPAPRTVEFCDHRRAVLDADLVHPVLVTVELEDPSVAAKSHGLERVENRFGRQLRIRCLNAHLGNSTRRGGAPAAEPYARMRPMRLPRPRSLSGLMLIGFTIVAAPLLFAIVNAAVQMNRLSVRSQQLVVHGMQGTRNNQRMFEEIEALDRQARLYQVTGSADLLDAYAQHHSRLITATREILTLPLD